MLQSEKIATLAQNSADFRKLIERKSVQFHSEKDAIEADGSLNSDQKDFKVKAVRDKILPSIIASVNEIQGISRLTRSQQQFWSNSVLVLAHQKFSDSPSSDAAVKQWNASRLAAMPLPQLSLEFENAKADKNFPLLGLVLNARMARKNDPAEAVDTSQFSIDGYPMPGQSEAMQSIASVEADRAHAENLFSEAASTRTNQASKLAAARARATVSKAA